MQEAGPWGGGRKRNGKAERQRGGQQRSVDERATGAGDAAAAAAAAATAAVAVPGATPRGAGAGVDLSSPLTHTVRAPHTSSVGGTLETLSQIRCCHVV